MVQPLVSIIIPVYNGANYLRDAIDSALSQSYQNIEVVVVNDGSKDLGKTAKVAKEYGEKIRYFEKPNGGVASALNFGIGVMRGEYFSWLSHDDFYYSNKIEDEVEILKQNSNAEIVVSMFDLVNERGHKIRRAYGADQYRNIMGSFLYTHLINGCALLIKKDIFTRFGLFNESLKTTQDYDYWLTIFGEAQYCLNSNTVLASRQHIEQGTNSMPEVVRAECSSFYLKALEKVSLKELLVQTQQNAILSFLLLLSYYSRTRFWKPFFLTIKKAIQNLGLKDFFWLMWHAVKLFFKYFFQKTRSIILKVFKAIAPNFYERAKIVRREFIFNKIYSFNDWGSEESRSGGGSTLEQTQIIRQQLPIIFRQLSTKKLLDIPCGDFNWMKSVDISSLEKYWGADIVGSVVKANTDKFSDNKVSFLKLDVLTDPIPDVDTILSRDCLVHFSFKDINVALKNITKSTAKYLITTTFTDRNENIDIETGQWRTINFEKPPFSWPKPLIIINEGCTEGDNNFKDKCLAVWDVESLRTAIKTSAN